MHCYENCQTRMKLFFKTFTVVAPNADCYSLIIVTNRSTRVSIVVLNCLLSGLGVRVRVMISYLDANACQTTKP